MGTLAKTASDLRDFPFIINHSQQIAFSTLSLLLSEQHALSNFQSNFIQRFSGKVLNYEDQVSFIASLWNSVSNFYFTSRLMAANKNSILWDVYNGSSFQKNSFKVVSKLRNDRDHISQNLGNLGKIKKCTPTNGVASWTYATQADLNNGHFFQQTFSVDPMLKAFSIDCARNIPTLKHANDNITLFAFNTALNISRARDELSELCVTLGDELNKSNAILEEKGIAKKDVLSEAEQRPFSVILQVNNNKN